MSYPTDKETFRRVVNQELPAIPGDVVDEDDQNLPASFLERLQDTLGYDIKMGYASVKAFFDYLVEKTTSLKKTEVISLYNVGGPGLVASAFWDEYGASADFLATDVVFFIAYLNWRRYENTTAYVNMRIQRGASNISPLFAFQGIENQGNLSSLICWTYATPTPGSATYQVRINQENGQGYWSRINLTAIKTSI